MHREPVDSSLLASAGYLPDQCLLEVELRSREIYRYFDVPPHAYDELMAAESKGRYFNAHIRKRFRYQQIHPHSSAGATV